MWTAELIKVERKRAMTEPTVRFSSDEVGVLPFEESFPGDDMTPERLAKFCKIRIMQLDARDAAFKRFILGGIDVSTVNLEVVVPPSGLK